MSDPLVSTPTACYSQIESSDVADVSILSQALGKSGRRGPQLFENHINHLELGREAARKFSVQALGAALRFDPNCLKAAEFFWKNFD